MMPTPHHLSVVVPTWGDFKRAREAIEREFHLHQEKGTGWRWHVPEHHALHALGHLVAALALIIVGFGRRHLIAMHLAHAACRTLMALEQYIARFGRTVPTTCPPPAPQANPRKEHPRDK